MDKGAGLRFRALFSGDFYSLSQYLDGLGWLADKCFFQSSAFFRLAYLAKVMTKIWLPPSYIDR